jgi:hypothetical protein
MVLGSIIRTAKSPKLAPAPMQRKVLGISTKLAKKKTSESIIDEFALKALV